MPLTGKEKVAILLSLLNPETSGRVLRFLPEEAAEVMAGGLQRISPPPKAVLALVLEEFNRFVALPSSPERKALEGPEKKKVIGGTAFDLLLEAPTKKLALVLTEERPQTIAFVLSLLPSPRRSEVLTFLPDARREVELLLKDLKENSLTPKVKEKVLDILVKKIF